MTDTHQESGMTLRHTRARMVRTPADVSIAPDSAGQVVLANVRGPVHLWTRAIGEAGMELVGDCFLPKNCAVLVSFPEIHALEPADAAASCLQVQGVVRKVHLIGPEPEYVIWVHLQQMDQAAQGVWQLAVEFGLQADEKNGLE